MADKKRSLGANCLLPVLKGFTPKKFLYYTAEVSPVGLPNNCASFAAVEPAVFLRVAFVESRFAFCLFSFFHKSFYQRRSKRRLLSSWPCWIYSLVKLPHRFLTELDSPSSYAKLAARSTASVYSVYGLYKCER